MRNDWKRFEAGKDAEVFANMVYCFAEIAGLVEKLGDLNIYHYDHIPIASKNYIQKILENCTFPLVQSKVIAV